MIGSIDLNTKMECAMANLNDAHKKLQKSITYKQIDNAKSANPKKNNQFNKNAGCSEEHHNNKKQNDGTKTNKSKKKSRSDLTAEIEALQKFIEDLTTRFPDVRPLALELMEKDRTLAEMKLLDREKNTTASNKPTQKDQRAAKKPQKKTPQKKKQNFRTFTQNSRTELEEMQKYINHIVLDHLNCPAGTEFPNELRFEGNFSDLESHAQKLVKAGLGRIVEEEIRINRKNNKQAFIVVSTDRSSFERDGMVQVPVARRYAFDGDTVRAFVLHQKKELNPDNRLKTIDQETSELVDEEDLQLCSDDSDIDQEDQPDAVQVVNSPKAFVIAVTKQIEMREIVGTISFKHKCQLSDNKLYFKLKPYDMRVPMVFVAEDSCRAYITKENLDVLTDTLFLALILETDVDGFCKANLLQPVGRVGDLSAEMKAIMYHNGLRDVMPFEQRFNDMYDFSEPKLSSECLGERKDYRKLCIFTIDPLTARDLDDAVSLEIIDGVYHVGVHISDVSYYLKEGSELDEIVKERATSIYLTNEVVHMLPEALCLKCSLLPGENKFAFSVFFELGEDGDMLNAPKFERSVIHCCAQLAYQHAQKIIDNPEEKFNLNDLPIILNGFSISDVTSRILALNNLAKKMRSKRFENGSLAIHQPKLRFELDPITGEPLSYEVETLGEANYLIEEFMLLANQAVAKFIYEAFPQTSILRNHPPPLMKSLAAVRDKLAPLGYNLEISSSKALHESIVEITKNSKRPDVVSACITQLILRPMARARYICSDNANFKADLSHYALAFPIYTHFTSPIRRYPDIMVHRLLAAALNYCAAPKRSAEELHYLMKVCNDKKYCAKCASDDSTSLFFKRYIKSKQQVLAHGAVIEIFQHALNVVLLESGYVVSIVYKEQKTLIGKSETDNCILVTEPNSNKKPLKLKLFSSVGVILTVVNNKLTAYLQSPDKSQRYLNFKNGNSTLLNVQNPKRQNKR